MIEIEEKKWKVYKHENLLNGKVYIGITSRTLNARARKNGSSYSKSPHFWSAICKYGWDNFSHEILVDGLTKDEACELEKEYISKYNSTDKKFGYNCSLGGESGNYGVKANDDLRKRLSEMRSGEKNHNYGKKMSEEVKDKIRKKKIGKTLSEEHKKKISESLYKNPPTKGVKMSDSKKRKLSDAKLGEKNVASKKIYCKELNRYFGSIREAERETGIPHENISKACRKVIKYAGKDENGNVYHWEYAC